MPSPHDINFPDDPDPVARWRREADAREEEFARQRAHAGREQQSKVQTMDSNTQAKWDSWADARIENRVLRLRDAFGDALGETAKELLQRQDKDFATLRREMRDQPPLFSAPDKKLSAVMVRVGKEIHRLGEGIEATRGAVAECAKRSDLGGVRLRLEQRIAALEERNETADRNLRGLNSMIFNLSTKLEHMHELLARFAAAADCENALNAVDRSNLQAEEQQKSAVVLSLEDLRYARSA
jgi:uncharacterized coiled-coil protein SlyX